MKFSKTSKIINKGIKKRLDKKEYVDEKFDFSDEGTPKEFERLDVTHVTEDGYLTLFSEGSFIQGNGTIRMYLMKGAIEEWFNNLDDDFEGYVTVGHVNTAASPVREGYFRKKDLKIIKNEDGRADLLVKPKINLNLSSVRDIIVQDEPFGISAEVFQRPYQGEETGSMVALRNLDLSFGGKGDFPIVESIGITGFSFVSDVGNAKSGGIDPKILYQFSDEKEKKLDKEKRKHFINTFMSMFMEDVEEPSDEKVSDEYVAEVEKQEESEPQEEKEISKEGELLEEALNVIESLKNENATLKEQLQAKEEENLALHSKEEELAGKISKFAEMLKKDDVEVFTPNEPKKEQTGLRKRWNGGV